MLSECAELSQPGWGGGPETAPLGDPWEVSAHPSMLLTWEPEASVRITACLPPPGPVDKISMEKTEQKQIERHMRGLDNDLQKLNTLLGQNRSSTEQLQQETFVTQGEFLCLLKVGGAPRVTSTGHASEGTPPGEHNPPGQPAGDHAPLWPCP